MLGHFYGPVPPPRPGLRVRHSAIRGTSTCGPIIKKRIIFLFVQDLTSLLRAMGQNPTDSQVNDMINEVDVDGSGVVQFGEFVNFFNRLMRNLNPDNEVREAFRRYSKVIIVHQPCHNFTKSAQV